MREIKFRGFDEENNCWRYGWYTRLVEGARVLDTIICFDDYRFLTRYYIHDDTTIGQFTGLHDKNGAEIYEGDLIHVFYKLLDGNYYVDAIYEVKNIDFRGLSLEFVKLTNDDSSNQIPVYELAYSRGTIGGYNGCIEVLSYYAHGEEFNHASKEVEIIGNIHEGEQPCTSAIVE